MAKKTRNIDEPETFFIPNNFVDAGTVMNGTFKIRNLLEALGILCGIGYLLLQIPGSIQLKAILIAVIAVPPTIVALIGVNDGPLSQFLFDFVRFLRTQKKIELYIPGAKKKATDSDPKHT